ncbi:tetratricopeptide repeat protein [Ornithinibacillus scapharcae]|uniref:tetratricopeptide repeat protein n=1 Tax=Ornithinibacillus scapharcae TaxID=1147159 RepID=UPI00110F85A8|nr:tetratricopeptide repeat protein [Ornithinibacillus scapharcae]
MEYDYCINCNLLLGVNYRKMREYDNAIDCYKKVIEQAYISKDFSLLAKVYHNIGLVYSKKEQYEIAIDYFLRSIEEEENKHALPSTYYLISKEYIMLGKLQDAKEWVLKGIRLAEKYDIKEYLIKLKSLECIVDTTKRYNLTTYINQVAIPFYEQRHDCESVSDLVLLLANYLEKERKYKDAYLLLKKQYKGEI